MFDNLIIDLFTYVWVNKVRTLTLLIWHTGPYPLINLSRFYADEFGERTYKNQNEYQVITEIERESESERERVRERETHTHTHTHTERNKYKHIHTNTETHQNKYIPLPWVHNLRNVNGLKEWHALKYTRKEIYLIFTSSFPLKCRIMQPKLW